MCLSWSLTVANMVLAVAQAVVSVAVLMSTHIGEGIPVAEFLFTGINVSIISHRTSITVQRCRVILILLCSGCRVILILLCSAAE